MVIRRRLDPKNSRTAKLQPGNFLACWARMLTVIGHRLEALGNSRTAELQPGGFLGCWARMSTVIRHRLEALKFKDCKAAAWKFPGLLGQHANGKGYRLEAFCGLQKDLKALLPQKLESLRVGACRAWRFKQRHAEAQHTFLKYWQSLRS